MTSIQIITKIDGRLQQLGREIEQLTSARTALLDAAAKPGPGRAAAKPGPGRAAAKPGPGRAAAKSGPGRAAAKSAAGRRVAKPAAIKAAATKAAATKAAATKPAPIQAATAKPAPIQAATAKPATAKPQPAPRKPAARANRAKVKPEVVPAGKLLSVLSASAGMTTSELATSTSGSQNQILALLKEQEAAGEVRRTGARRSTRWHAVTDEDRVAARAAELARQSRQAGSADVAQKVAA